MNNKLMLGILIVLLVIGVTFLVRTNQQNYQTQDNNKPSNTVEEQNQQSQGSNTGGGAGQQQINATTNSGKITLDTLAQHNSKNDCWIAYDGKVYDITDYLPRHPGTSSRIEPYCGSADEFKKAFEKKHGKSKVNLLMQVGTFIGDFDVIGNIETSPPVQNLSYNKKVYTDGDDDDEDDNEYEDD